VFIYFLLFWLHFFVDELKGKKEEIRWMIAIILALIIFGT